MGKASAFFSYTSKFLDMISSERLNELTEEKKHLLGLLERHAKRDPRVQNLFDPVMEDFGSEIDDQVQEVEELEITAGLIDTWLHRLEEIEAEIAS